MCDLKVAQLNVQPNLIREVIFNEFELDHNAAETFKNICCAKGEDIIDHSRVNR